MYLPSVYVEVSALPPVAGWRRYTFLCQHSLHSHTLELTNSQDPYFAFNVLGSGWFDL